MMVVPSFFRMRAMIGPLRKRTPMAAEFRKDSCYWR